MRDQSSTRPRVADTSHAAHGAEPTPASPPPAAAGPHEHDATADEHAGMTADEHAGKTADEHAGMTADEHAGMQPAAKSEGAQAGHAGHDAGGAADRPVGLLLGGFGALNGLVLIVAAVMRRRGPAAKRRATLARVRASAGAATVPRAPTVERRS
jgi:hypothetical protein